MFYCSKEQSNSTSFCFYSTPLYSISLHSTSTLLQTPLDKNIISHIGQLKIYYHILPHNSSALSHLLLWKKKNVSLMLDNNRALFLHFSAYMQIPYIVIGTLSLGCVNTSPKCPHKCGLIWSSRIHLPRRFNECPVILFSSSSVARSRLLSVTRATNVINQFSIFSTKYA